MTRIQGRPKQGRKLTKMKNRKTIFAATVLVLAFALAPGAWASPRPDGGPDYQLSTARAVALKQPDGGPDYQAGLARASASRETTSADSNSAENVEMPIITIHSAGDITRGKTGSFVLDMKPRLLFGGAFVNFSVSGTASPGVDYVPLVPPAYIGNSGYGVIQIQTLPDPRASASRRAYSVVVTLEPGLAYALGVPSSAQMMIKP
jgi:hypothetical protein